jgi:hypothetical protein
MAVSQQEERLITLVLDDGKETCELLLCEEVDLARAAPAFGCRSVGGRRTANRITVLIYRSCEGECGLGSRHHFR